MVNPVKAHNLSNRECYSVPTSLSAQICHAFAALFSKCVIAYALLPESLIRDWKYRPLLAPVVPPSLILQRSMDKVA